MTVAFLYVMEVIVRYLYKQWRDNEFVRIKDVYELKHNGVRCTVEELSGLFNFIQENGTKEKFLDNSNAMDENYHSYSVIDISDVQDLVKYFVDVEIIKAIIENY